MTWFAFSGLNSGKAVDLAGTQEKQAVIEGFHGYATEAQAEAHPNSVNLVTRVLADGWIADYSAAVREGAQPGGPNATILNPADATRAGVSYVESEIPGLQQVGAFFSRLTEANTWERLGEVVLGVILIAVGIAHMTRAVPAATAIASKVP
jgi:hypothetical protein